MAKKLSGSRFGVSFVPCQTKQLVYFENGLPRILVSRSALVKMGHYVDIAPDEVGWLGSCEREGNDFIIDDVFLFDQEVSSSCTEITADGLAKFASEILKQPGGLELCNRIRFWGHSHANMGFTTPSPQDDKQMEDLRQSCPDYFIRGIFNKNGEARFTLYLYDVGLKIVDCGWQAIEPIDDVSRDALEEEYRKKVKPRSYSYVGAGYAPYAPTSVKPIERVAKTEGNGSCHETFRVPSKSLSNEKDVETAQTVIWPEKSTDGVVTPAFDLYREFEHRDD